MKVTISTNNDKIERFDVKQMICHLLGIATGILTSTLEKKEISFIYLLFDPTKLPLESDVKSIIDAIYERTVFESYQIDWSTLFRIILEFLNDNKFKGIMNSNDINKTVCDFRFTLVSQDTYSEFIK
jgi:hypothetical protein